MVEPYLQPLKALLHSHANAENAVAMKKYMRDQFEFLGIKSPEAKALFKRFVTEQGLPTVDSLEEIVREIWLYPEREFQYMAQALLDRLQSQITPEFVPLLEHLITTKSWWDTVDFLATHSVGKLLQQYPERRDRVLDPWRHSDNIWLRRTTLLFQLHYKDGTDESLLFNLIQENSQSTEFFIQKAIGWALREYSKTAPQAVKTFVNSNGLAPLSAREALKWIKAQGQL